MPKSRGWPTRIWGYFCMSPSFFLNLSFFEHALLQPATFLVGVDMLCVSAPANSYVKLILLCLQIISTLSLFEILKHVIHRASFITPSIHANGVFYWHQRLLSQSVVKRKTHNTVLLYWLLKDYYSE